MCVNNTTAGRGCRVFVSAWVFAKSGFLGPCALITQQRVGGVKARDRVKDRAMVKDN